MQTYENIQWQVGAWSLANFGHQETPYLDVAHAGEIKRGRARSSDDFAGETVYGYVACLGSLAPLLGLAEEVGELTEAIAREKQADAEDAIGDIAIYLCDYLCRENVCFPTNVEMFQDDQFGPPTVGAYVYLGKLFRVHLKRFQRIRGMEDQRLFRAAQIGALCGFVWHMEALSKGLIGKPWLAVLDATWTKIVSKRDWLGDAAAGGGHTHGGNR